MERIGAPSLLTRTTALWLENFRRGWDVRFNIFAGARPDFLERRTAIALWRRFACRLLFAR
jgi:hypothetical protein